MGHSQLNGGDFDDIQASYLPDVRSAGCEVTRNRFSRAWALANAQRGGLMKRCTGCHAMGTPLEMPYHLLKNNSSGVSNKSSRYCRPYGPNERIVVPNDPLARFSSDVLYNFTRPDKSPILLAPLAQAAGGCDQG